MLDADDFFYPDKVERVIPYSQPGSMLYHRLQIESSAETIPPKIAPYEDYYLHAQLYGFFPYMASPTSGIVIRRDLALSLIPLPTEHVRISADAFLVRAAALLGQAIGIPDVLAVYRVHGENAWYGKRMIPKSPVFMEELEKYLNRKLIDAGKRPVIDFYNSMYAIAHIPQSAAELARLGVSVFSRHANLVTLKFMLRTLLRAVKCGMSPASSGCARQN